MGARAQPPGRRGQVGAARHARLRTCHLGARAPSQDPQLDYGRLLGRARQRRPTKGRAGPNWLKLLAAGRRRARQPKMIGIVLARPEVVGERRAAERRRDARHSIMRRACRLSCFRPAAQRVAGVAETPRGRAPVAPRLAPGARVAPQKSAAPSD